VFAVPRSTAMSRPMMLFAIRAVPAVAGVHPSQWEGANAPSPGTKA
jgi:hypothetical protein